VRGHSPRSTHTAIAAIMIALVVLVTANILVLIKIMGTLTAFSNLHQKGQSLPCPAIPTRLVLEDPACAQKLIEAMNVTNVRIRQEDIALLHADDETHTRVHGVPTTASER